MDNTLELKLKSFKKALETLEEVLNLEKDDVARDSAIKRFEYCFELCWKTSKVFLSDKMGTDIFSPKECFRELRKNKLIKDEEAELALKMVDDRNEIIHTYSEEFSKKLYKKINKEYFGLMKVVLNAVEE